MSNIGWTLFGVAVCDNFFALLAAPAPEHTLKKQVFAWKVLHFRMSAVCARSEKDDGGGCTTEKTQLENASKTNVEAHSKKHPTMREFASQIVPNSLPGASWAAGWPQEIIDYS